jgi:uncharacterized protein YeeX (DUF496 family)
MEKHSTLCEIIFKTKHNKKIILEEDDELPSQRRLYQMLLELGQKYNRLEEKVDEISKWAVTKKKKINIVEYLNTTLKPEISFDKLSNFIEITESDIEYLFQNTFLDTLNMIFEKTIYNMEKQNKPIIAFQQKLGVFYIFEETQWVELPKDKLILFLNRCHKKISKALSEWKKNNLQKIKEEDNYAIKYDKTVSKVMGVEFRHDATFNKTKTMIHNYLKQDMKSFTEYEFEF